MMIVSLSNTIIACPQQQQQQQQQWGVAARAAWPVFGFHLDNRRVTTCLNKGSSSPVRCAVGCSKRRASTVANYEEEKEEENDLEYESDWEVNGNDKVVGSNADALSMRKYEEDLVKEVERMLRPEERAI